MADPGEMHQLNVDEVKLQFRTLGCEVKDMSADSFEIVPPVFPVVTLVYPNPCFVQFNTCIFARPLTFLGRFRWKRDALMNAANLEVNLVRLTCSETKLDQGVWTLIAQAKFVPGEIMMEYPHQVLDNFVTLWLQDIAKIIAIESEYELIGLLKK